jgi:hypothetical protein
MNSTKTASMARFGRAAYLSTLVLAFTLTSGCGFVYQRITQTYENKEIIPKAQAIGQINEVTPCLVHSVWSQFQYADENGIHYIQNTKYHYVQKYIAFADVCGIRKQGVVGSPTDVSITLLDKNDKSLYTFEFIGPLESGQYAINPNGPGGNTPKSVQPFLSSLLALCPNAR